MVPISQSLAAFIILTVVVTSIYGWVCFLRNRTIGSLSVPYESRQAVPWGLLDIVLIVLAVVFVQVIAAATAAAFMGAQLQDASPIIWMAVSQAALLIAWGGVMFLMQFRCAEPKVDLGLVFRKTDFKLGALAFAMMAPPMFALQAVLSQFSDKQHPLIETLIEDSNTLFFIVAGFAAVVVAPIVEEFVFRVFLQGWLENLAAYRLAQRRGTRFRTGFGSDLFWGLGLRHGPAPSIADATEEAAAGDAKRLTEGLAEDGEVLTDELAPVDLPLEQESDNPYSSPTAQAADSSSAFGASATAEPTEKYLPMRPSFWPVLASSVVFAAAHIGNGPDPIPLFFLAIGLGLLYQRTHRVWPCITVHCLLNGLSLFNLWVIVNSPELAEQLMK